MQDDDSKPEVKEQGDASSNLEKKENYEVYSKPEINGQNDIYSITAIQDNLSNDYALVSTKKQPNETGRFF